MKWKKLGKIFDPTNYQNDWMSHFAQSPHVLMFDDFIRVYFSPRPLPESNGDFVSRGAYVDLDRKDFSVINVGRQPIMPLGDKGKFDEFGTYPISVIRNQGKIEAYHAGWNRPSDIRFNVAIGKSVSVDNGITFQRVSSDPILPYTPDEPFIMSGPKIRKFGDTFYLFYIAGSRWIMDAPPRPEPVYQIRMATSPDGVVWTKHGKNLLATKLEDNECQTGPDVFERNGIYHMFFSYRYPHNYKNKERGYRIGYASSSDLVNWKRNDEIVGIDVGETGWDSEMINYPHIFENNGKTYMLYNGNEFGKYGFGAAVLEGELGE